MGIKLVVKICALFGLVAIAEGAILLSPMSRAVLNNTYYDAWRVKHSHLVGSGENRLIIAGGSNSAFGIDSSMLESSTARQTINLGLHGGLGLSLMLHELEDGARAGDLVVLIPEYELFYGDLMNGDLPATELVQHDQSALKYFSTWRQWRNLLRNTQVLTSAATFALIDRAKQAVLGRHPGPPGETVYRSSGFDVHGDMVAHLSDRSHPDKVAAGVKRMRGEFNPQAIDAIVQCAAILASRGVELMVVYPAVAASWWALNHDLADHVAGLLPGRSSYIRPEDWVLEDGLFYDTPYHLNGRGRQERTTRLAHLLEAAGRGTVPMTLGTRTIPFTGAIP